MASQRRRSSMLAYPTDHLMAVLDDPARVPAARAALEAAGIPTSQVTVLVGGEDAASLGPLGRRSGWRTRLLRLVQFTTMDQMPDLRMYEAAAASGRAVLAVHVADRAALGRARKALEGAGAHFLNYYGRFYTEELTRWRGPELDLPDHLRR